jgi:adenylate cyclase
VQFPWTEGQDEQHKVDAQRLLRDLRGFTSFSNRHAPEVVMKVLDEYHAAVGAIIVRRAATLTNFAGDGIMLLINAPVSCPNPAVEALSLAIDIRSAVQGLIAGWCERDYGIGLGIGLAMGPATVGRIGYEGQLAYMAIGTAVNLAARLCSAAIDGQVLVDEAIAAAYMERYRCWSDTIDIMNVS